MLTRSAWHLALRGQGPVQSRVQSGGSLIPMQVWAGPSGSHLPLPSIKEMDGTAGVSKTKERVFIVLTTPRKVWEIIFLRQKGD